MIHYEKMMKGLECCASPSAGTENCKSCPYNDPEGECIQKLCEHAIEYIREHQRQLVEVRNNTRFMFPESEWQYEEGNPRRMTCAACGQKTAVRWNHCPHCGAKILGVLQK